MCLVRGAWGWRDRKRKLDRGRGAAYVFLWGRGWWCSESLSTLKSARHCLDTFAKKREAGITKKNVEEREGDRPFDFFGFEGIYLNNARTKYC